NASAGAVLGSRTNLIVLINTDHDSGFQLKFPNLSVAEDAGAVLVDVVRDDDGTLPTSVDIFTSDVTATNGIDYIGITNTLSFGAQERVKSISIPVLNNILKQTNRIFRVSLANPVGAPLGRVKAATITIVDNDQGFQFDSPGYLVSQDAGVARLGI